MDMQVELDEGAKLGKASLNPSSTSTVDKETVTTYSVE